MELWYTELQTPDLGITMKTEKTLHTEKTEFQEMAVIETKPFGRMLVLDGTVQTTMGDEFVYHEMITHVALMSHPNPKTALVIGGGDGGAIREILKHPTIEKAVLVEIDGRVIEVSKQYFPALSGSLQDARVEVCVEDGIAYVERNKSTFDVIMVDSTDPVGPAVGLFQKDFYQMIQEALTDEGIFVAQTESPFLHKTLMRDVYHSVESIFPITKVFLCSIPTYPSGSWSFTLGSKTIDPERVDLSDKPSIQTRYYTKELHRACFVLPQFVLDFLHAENQQD